ncbi:hypothetical protein TrLO_g4232 [Triparma laevis f. longispina]|uniref:Uncharacterized protein n=1 Tax=Triparma laevis f. longispina TaxID=1714387 RepID=A0A9W7ED82_9STRA|nr:hypothetical protein TrLO_g4232 [Triparma laevis f. longispina]
MAIVFRLVFQFDRVGKVDLAVADYSVEIWNNESVHDSLQKISTEVNIYTMASLSDMREGNLNTWQKIALWLLGNSR